MTPVGPTYSVEWKTPDGYTCTQPKKLDPSNPYYYDEMDIQPSEYILANNLGWCEANIVKYISRWHRKGGVDDLKKAQSYLGMLIERESA